MKEEEEEVKIMRSFEANKKEYNELKSRCSKDGTDIGEKLNAFIKRDNLEHGDGNPAFTLDQFVENDQMKAVLAVFRTRKEWDSYLMDLKDSNPKLLQEILWQSQTIGSLSQKWMKYL